MWRGSTTQSLQAGQREGPPRPSEPHNPKGRWGAGPPGKDSAKVERCAAEVKELQTKAKKLAAENERLRNQLDDAMSAMALLEEAQGKVEEKANEEVKRVRMKLEEQQIICVKLREAKAQASINATEVEGQLRTQLDEQSIQLMQMSASTEANESGATERIKNLQMQLKDQTQLTIQLHEVTAELAVEKDEKKRLASELDAVLKRVKDLEMETSKGEGHSQELMRQVEDRNCAVGVLEEAHRKAEENTSKLRFELREKEAACSELEERLSKETFLTKALKEREEGRIKEQKEGASISVAESVRLTLQLEEFSERSSDLETELETAKNDLMIAEAKFTSEMQSQRAITTQAEVDKVRAESIAREESRKLKQQLKKALNSYGNDENIEQEVVEEMGSPDVKSLKLGMQRQLSKAWKEAEDWKEKQIKTDDELKKTKKELRTKLTILRSLQGA